WIFSGGPHGPACLGFPYGQYGYEGFFLVCGLHPEVIEGLWLAEARLARWHNECVAEAARRLDWPSIGYLGSDMTDQRGNMIPPRMMAERFFPHLDHAIQPLVDAEFKLIWHSDGNMNDMLGPLIDIGVAGFQGFQEECGTCIADVAKRRNRNGDPLILWGSFSVTRVLLTGSFADLRREVQRILDEWPHPGLCLATASYLSPDIPEQNITELYRVFREMGRR
ncbi:uroporphyrinogen decarboxylase family protein, partial [Verrucomicrobiota bacterium]